MPNEAEDLESLVLSKLSLKSIDLNKYVNLTTLEVSSLSALETLDVNACSKLTKLTCKRNTKLATLTLPTVKNVLTELDCEYTALKAIYLKEMRSYFHSLAAYIYFALFIAATGVYFSVICMSYGYTDYAQYVFSNSTILYIVIVPILTMRLFAEEKKQRTDQLLYTSPIRSGSIVFGKYLASVTLLAISMLVSIIEAGVLSMFGNVNWKTVLTGCLGYFLLGACLMAVGMFVSSLTDNQMIAAALSFAVVLFCMLLPNISNVVPGRARYTYIVCVLAVILIAWFFYDETKNVKITAGVGVAGIAIIAILSKVKPALFDNGLSKIIDWFSVLDRFNDFCSGILNASSIVYYVSFIAVFLFLTMQGIEKRRWN